jgi:sRNA-binding protein
MTSSRNERDVTVAMLCARFPKAFFLYERRRVPLKIGIRNDVIAVLGDAIDRKLLVRALKHYFVNLGYQLAVRAGRPRYDLDGNVAGQVCAQEAEYALRAIAGLKAMREPKKKSPAVTPAPETPAPPPPPPSPPEPPRRLGLSDLRAAALARKASADADQTPDDAAAATARTKSADQSRG